MTKRYSDVRKEQDLEREYEDISKERLSETLLAGHD